MASKLDYLKKYASSSSSSSSSKKRSSSSSSSSRSGSGSSEQRVRVLDEENDWKAAAPTRDINQIAFDRSRGGGAGWQRGDGSGNGLEELEEGLEEDRPQVVVLEEPQVRRSGGRWVEEGGEGEMVVGDRREEVGRARSLVETSRQSRELDASPPRRRRRHDSDSDASPPRAGRASIASAASARDASPPRRRRHDSDSDASPPRAGRNSAASAASARDASPPRRRRHDSDASPPRASRASTAFAASAASARDASPPRRRRHDSDSDASPPRARPRTEVAEPAKSSGQTTQEAARRKTFEELEAELDARARNKLAQTSSGHSTGLLSKEAFAASESALRASRTLDLSKANAELTGQTAQTVYRDRQGRKLDKLEEMMKEEAIRQGKEANKKKLEEATYEWGKGTVQKAEKEAARQELEDLTDAPFARMADDPKLEAYRKGLIRDGDPMAQYFAQKQALEEEEARQASASASSGKPARPVYKGPPPPPNRFNIRPGYRWDGVDRGNGFEKRLLNQRNAKHAQREDEYKWSVSDM